MRVFTTSDSDPVYWSSLQSGLQPPSLSAAAWSSIYENLNPQLGPTWGGYVQMLDNQAVYLGHLGENVNDISQLWQFAVLQADNALPPSTQLAAATDIAAGHARRLSLDFSRQYLAPIGNRQTLGPLGYGWTDDWQYSLSLASDGTVTVAMPGGAERVFQPDSRGFGYPSLRPSRGLRRPDEQRQRIHPAGIRRPNRGLQQRRRAGLQARHIQDANGNRITAGYDPTSGQLISLTAYAAERRPPR